MNKLFIAIIIILLSSCNSRIEPKYSRSVIDPYTQNLNGKIKSITRRHFYIFDGCHPDSIAHLRNEKKYQAHNTTYDSSGRVITDTDTFPELRYDIIHKEMVYTSNKLSHWIGRDITARAKYDGKINFSGDTLFQYFTVNKKDGDTSLIETYVQRNKKIEVQKSFHDGDTVIYAEKKIFSYTQNGTMSSCQYITGIEEGTNSEFIIISKDDHGNPLQVNEVWNNGKCRVIEYFYEYF